VQRNINDVEYGKGGDKPLLLDLVIPDSADNAPHPAVIWIHGGGWCQGEKSPNRLVWMANCGYVVASIDYRLVQEAIFPAQIHDCKAAVRFIRQHAGEYAVDPNRIGVAGESAGGHLSALLGLTAGVAELEGNGGSSGFSSEAQAVCDFFGPSDLTKLEGSPAELIPYIADFLGGDPRDRSEVARLASPVTHVNSDSPPTLIIHGDQDDLVPLGQSEILHGALQNVGAEVELLVVENGGHGFWGTNLRPSLEEIDEAVLKFFDRTLKQEVAH
jgi:acetyl esterase/lipase